MSELKSQVSLSLTMYHPLTSQQHTQFHRKNNNWIQMMSRFSNRKPSIAASSLSLLPQRMCTSHTHTRRLHNKYLYNKIALHFYSIFFFFLLPQTRIFLVQFLQNLSFAFGIRRTNKRKIIMRCFVDSPLLLILLLLSCVVVVVVDAIV